MSFIGRASASSRASFSVLGASSQLSRANAPSAHFPDRFLDAVGEDLAECHCHTTRATQDEQDANDYECVLGE